MPADLCRVLLEFREPKRRVGLRRRRPEGIRGRLGVHSYELAARQRDNDVGSDASGLVGVDLLGPEVAVLHHAGQLDHAPSWTSPQVPAVLVVLSAEESLVVSTFRRSWAVPRDSSCFPSSP